MPIYLSSESQKVINNCCFIDFFRFPVVPFFYFSDKYILKIPKIFSALEKIFQLYINHGSGQSYSMLQLSEMQLKSSMKTPQNHFDSKCMINETTLGMVVDGQWMIMFKGSKFILKKLLKDIFHTRKKRTVVDCS